MSDELTGSTYNMNCGRRQVKRHGVKNRQDYSIDRTMRTSSVQVQGSTCRMSDRDETGTCQGPIEKYRINRVLFGNFTNILTIFNRNPHGY